MDRERQGQQAKHSRDPGQPRQPVPERHDQQDNTPHEQAYSANAKPGYVDRNDIDLVEHLRNGLQRTLRKQPHWRVGPQTHALDDELQRSVLGTDRTHHVLVWPQRVCERSLGTVADLAETRGQTAVEHDIQLSRQLEGLRPCQVGVEIVRSRFVVFPAGRAHEAEQRASWRLTAQGVLTLLDLWRRRRRRRSRPARTCLCKHGRGGRNEDGDKRTRRQPDARPRQIAYMQILHGCRADECLPDVMLPCPARASIFHRSFRRTG